MENNGTEKIGLVTPTLDLQAITVDYFMLIWSLDIDITYIIYWIT